MKLRQRSRPANWRDDPDWRLASFDPQRRKPGDRPPPNAELAQPPIWASLFDGDVLVATWFRGEIGP